MLVLASVTAAYGKQQDAIPADSREKLSFSLWGAPLMPHLGLFAEYEMHEAFGLRGGLLSGYNFILYEDKDYEDKVNLGLGYFSYVAAPLILRWYPALGRQFCIFVGGQGGFRLSDLHNNPFLGYGGLGIKKWIAYAVAGLHYEFSNGFQTGLDINYRLTKLLKENVDILTHFSSRIGIGYNLAKLF